MSNCIGGFVGDMMTFNSCSVQSINSSVSVKVDNEQCYATDISIGAFGATQATDKSFSMTNIFSAVEVDKICDDIHGYPAYSASAIIGKASYYAKKDAPSPKGYESKNVFGYVKQIDEITNETAYSLELFNYPSHTVHTEINCAGSQMVLYL